VFQLLSRSLIYIVFVGAAGIGWLLHHRKARGKRIGTDALKNPIEFIAGTLDHPGWKFRLAAVRALGTDPTVEQLAQLIPMLRSRLKIPVR
jgi:hypothetical protein